MTSKERKEARFQRRKERREEKMRKTCSFEDCFETVFSYRNLYHSYKLCRRGVAWKASTQLYIAKAPLNVWKAFYQLRNKTFRSDGFKEFDIRERGKTRHIRSVSIKERVVQRCLCDYALIQRLSRSFIYDNGATLKNKGYSFTVKRLCRHLRKHYRKYGQEGYVLLFDFSKFFDNVSHQTLKHILRRSFSDEDIIDLTVHFIDAFGDTGLGLGSQISQVLALASANRLDHYIKEVLRIEGYGRYMDDGYLIHPSKEYLQMCLKRIQEVCGELGIKLNWRKTQIVKLSHGFSFLKVKFYLSPSGKIIRRLCRQSVVRERRKLKALFQKAEDGVLDTKDIYASFQSWRAYAANFDSHRAVRNMEALYYTLLNSRKGVCRFENCGYRPVRHAG